MSSTTRTDRPLHSGGLAIEVTALTKTFGAKDSAVRALNEVSFGVRTGTVFGLLGPNGAGKSTTVRILTTLSAADGGRAVVAGHDVARAPAQVRRSIGYVPQKPCFDPTSTGRENLALQARIHGLPRGEAARRSGELLDRFGLAGAADRLARTWSGGMQRKLDVALGLIHQPAVLFLDEPTTGLDPEARAEMWAEIAQLNKQDGLTVLLTTHYLEEADQLADRLAIVDRGAVVATGTPDDLKADLASDTIQIGLADPSQAPHAATIVEATVDRVGRVDVEGSTVRLRVAAGTATMPHLLAALAQSRVELASITLSRPTLDDVYLRHAGRSYQSADQVRSKEAV